MPVTDQPSGNKPSRRDFVALGVGVLVVASVTWRSRRRTLAQRTIPSMGTVADFTVVHGNEQYAQAAITAAIARLRMVESLMTRYQPSSDVGRANRKAGQDGVRVTPETATVLTTALDWASRTDGAFDPALGGAIALWDVGHRTSPPPADAVRRYAARGFYRALDVGSWAGRQAVRFTQPDVGIDLGGIAKGYGVDQAVAVLREWGITHALVNVGGDLYAMGRSADDGPWRVGVRSPERADRLVAEFDLEDAAVATSGDYLQYFDHHGRRYHHLLDPATGEPTVSRMRSITIRASDCMTADAAATACFGREPSATRGWLGPTEARIVHSV
ncbi:MAG: FAD:protein FMN transferase [Gemmatimonadota bacterium]|nr:FAD:protein FMN transferase [Gemmatimonadota bacterium]MDH4350786.1 FAD:protein FMN transferase [Gemmatimonadota bacterium]